MKHVFLILAKEMLNQLLCKKNMEGEQTTKQGQEHAKYSNITIILFLGIFIYTYLNIF